MAPIAHMPYADGRAAATGLTASDRIPSSMISVPAKAGWAPSPGSRRRMRSTLRPTMSSGRVTVSRAAARPSEAMPGVTPASTPRSVMAACAGTSMPSRPYPTAT